MFRGVLILAFLALAAPATGAAAFPETIALPDGWQGEGIATGRGNDVFAGDRETGAIWKGDLRSGTGDVLVEPDGGAALGLKVDRRNRLFVAGGGTGTATVYDAGDGELLRRYDLTDAPTFINDVIVTRRAAYFTDSLRLDARLFVLDLGRSGQLPDAARSLPLTGDLQYDADPGTFELNGIAATRNGKWLIAVQSRTATLFRIDPRTGETEDIDGVTVENGDGLLLHGRTLYVVQNRSNQIAVVRLDRDLLSGEVVDELTHPEFAVPTTIAPKGSWLYAVNARFGLDPSEDDEDDIVRVRRR